MKRPVLAAAVLCVLAAQPASAAWQTSAPGTAKAKAAAVTAPTGITCATSTGVVTWQAVGGVPNYDLRWSDKGNGDGNFTTPVRVSSTSYTVTGGTPLRVRVRAVAGSWTSSYTEQNCS
ncbi:hypothetical protein [Lentzea albida]|uniref:Fibronectin type-III domain-containing protein n=1 Tax=Lentzea albida TaxID=65499 RepID=A0A1H9VVD7_9PSEU|nr:hypothetical protein [Lentzea albida]SES25572.1 hypothetical protein SAMN04488000_119153 [Lentzea albida]